MRTENRVIARAVNKYDNLKSVCDKFGPFQKDSWCHRTCHLGLPRNTLLLLWMYYSTSTGIQRLCIEKTCGDYTSCIDGMLKMSFMVNFKYFVAVAGRGFDRQHAAKDWQLSILGK